MFHLFDLINFFSFSFFGTRLIFLIPVYYFFLQLVGGSCWRHVILSAEESSTHVEGMPLAIKLCMIRWIRSICGQFGKALFKNVDSTLFCSVVLYRYQRLEFTSMLDCYVNLTEWRPAPTPLESHLCSIFLHTHPYHLWIHNDPNLTLIQISCTVQSMTRKICVIYGSCILRFRNQGLESLDWTYIWNTPTPGPNCLPQLLVSWLLCIRWAS